MQEKPVVYVDMDGVLCDFAEALTHIHPDIIKKYDGEYDNIPGLFGMMKPINDAVETVTELCKDFDVYILSTAPWGNPLAWVEKRNWIANHFGDLLKKRLILNHHKNLCKGDYLIDDNIKNGVSEFEGFHIHFGTQKFPDWCMVRIFLYEQLEMTKRYNKINKN